MRQLFDPFRNVWVAATPEEIVRQKLLQTLLQLGYPKEMICVENHLRTLPHLKTFQGKLPDRRLDILCYQKKEESMTPLLVIECKAIPLSDSVIQQVIGYNHFVQAPYIAIANETHLVFGYYDPKEQRYHLQNTLPPFASLLQKRK